MSLSLKPVTASNIQTYWNYFMALCAEQQSEQFIRTTPQHLLEGLTQEGCPFHAFVLLKGETPVGCFGYERRFSPYKGLYKMFLKTLYIDPQYRKDGIGRQAVKAFASIAWRNNYGEISWETMPDNKKAQTFFAKLGAKEDPEVFPLFYFDSDAIKALAHGN